MSIDVRNLSFAYGKRQVLRQVSFRTSPGQLVAVLGPNGAGKSTLFRCILGFLPRYRGEIALCGHDLRSLDRRRLARLAAYIPQSSAPVYNYTVRDTVLMGADPFHGPGPSQQETADRVLETLGIRDLADRGINEISGGERQLALIARAMAQQAKILLMDEPTASLDYGNQFRLLRQVRQLADSGYTVLLSTHNPEHSFRFATDVLVLREGLRPGGGDPDGGAAAGDLPHSPDGGGHPRPRRQREGLRIRCVTGRTQWRGYAPLSLSKKGNALF